MNTKQKLQDLILKYKNQKENNLLVNELCRLYFEIEEQNKKESPFEGSQLEKINDSFISRQCLLELNFNAETSNIYFIEQKDKRFIYNIQTKEVSLFDAEEEQYITLPKLYHSISELRNLIDLIF